MTRFPFTTISLKSNIYYDSIKVFTSAHKTVELRSRFHIKTDYLLHHTDITAVPLYTETCICHNAAVLTGRCDLQPGAVRICTLYIFIYTLSAAYANRKKGPKGNKPSKDTFCSQVNTEMEKPQGPAP